MESDFVQILPAAFALSLLFMIRICRDSERVALNTPRRFVKLVGPGLFFKYPFRISPYAYTRIRSGDSGRYLGNGWAKIGGVNVPVRAVRDLEVDENLRVKDFVNQEIFAEPGAQS